MRCLVLWQGCFIGCGISVSSRLSYSHMPLFSVWHSGIPVAPALSVEGVGIPVVLVPAVADGLGIPAALEPVAEDNLGIPVVPALSVVGVGIPVVPVPVVADGLGIPAALEPVAEDNLGIPDVQEPVVVDGLDTLAVPVFVCLYQDLCGGLLHKA